LNTFEPIRANLQPWVPIVAKFKKSKNLKEMFLSLYNGPAWSPGVTELGSIPPCTRASVQKYDTKLSAFWKLYLLGLFLYATAGSQLAMLGLNALSGLEYWLNLVLIVYFGFTLYVVGITW
jgi:hypothetical protein